MSKNDDANTIITSNEKHIEWIDFARTFAIFCVVLCHTVEKIYPFNIRYIQYISVQSRVFCFLGFTLGRCGVPVFLMITGYLLLGRTYDEIQCRSFWRYKWLYLVLCYELWNVIYDVYLCVFHQVEFSIDRLLREVAFLSLTNLTHIWYFPMIIGLYLLVPLVANGLNSVNYKLLQRPIGVLFMTVLVFPVINISMKIFGMETYSMKMSEGFSGGVYGIYLVLGFLIKKGLLKKWKGYWICLTGSITFILIVMQQLWAYHQGIVYNVWYDCGLLTVSTVCMFEMFSRVKRIKFYKLIKVFSYYSFAIYLVHNMILNLPSFAVQKASMLQPVRVALLWAGVLSLSLFCAVVINRIPKAGKILFYKK